MHQNRSKYNLEGYQTILLQRAKTFFILCKNKETETNVLINIRPKSLWHRNFQEAYSRPKQILLLNKFKSGKNRMITLTYNTNLYTPEEVAFLHKKHIKDFIRRIRKIIGKFEYCYFIELTKNNYIHFHIFTDTFVAHKMIKFVWEKITRSTIVDVHLIKNSAQMYYCSSYSSIAKKWTQEQLEFAWKHISRIYGTSRNYFPKKEMKESKYEFIESCLIKLDEKEELSKARTVDLLGEFNLETFLNELCDREVSVKKTDKKDFYIYSYSDDINEMRRNKESDKYFREEEKRIKAEKIAKIFNGSYIYEKVP